MSNANEQQPVLGDPPPKDNVLLSNHLYDQLKFIAQVLLPGIGALYYGLAGIWGFPRPDDVVGTITVLDTFLGLFLVAGSRQYKKSDGRFDGHIAIEDNVEEGYSNVNVRVDPKALSNKDEVTLKVKDITNKEDIPEF